MKNFRKVFFTALCLMISNHFLMAQTNNLQPAKLFATLPTSCPTPDAFDIAPDGSLTLSCANYADRKKTGVLLKISKEGKVSHLVNVPVLKESGVSRPMGIAYGADGCLYICDNQGNKGRLLKMTFDGDVLTKTEIVAFGFSAINGIRYYNDAVYVTQTNLPKLKKKQLVSGVYRFNTTDRNIKVNNDNSDKNLIYTSITKNKKRQVGLDGLVFNSSGDLFVGNLGDATIYKLTLTEEGKVSNEEVYAQLPLNSAPDGINIDKKGNLYVAGFAQNQIFKIATDKKVTLIAEYEDNNGENGKLDQPADVIVFGNKLIISNFDLMVTKGMKNSKHSKPYTVSSIEIE